MDISHGLAITLQDAHVLESLPYEILDIIRSGNSPNFLDALAIATLNPTLTLRFFARFEHVFADTCARWISRPSSPSEKITIIESFARIIPFAPHLSVYLQRYLGLDTPTSKIGSSRSHSFPYLSYGNAGSISELSVEKLQGLLLATFRLLIFDKITFMRSISTSKIQALLHHTDPPIRYLAVKIFCILLSASDAKLDSMLCEHVGRKEVVMGLMDGRLVDYEFLGLFERRQAKNLDDFRAASITNLAPSTLIEQSYLSPLVSCYGSVILPRLNGPPATPSSLVTTPTTSRNLEAFSEALLQSSPILVHGLSGSGKTSLVNDIARELGKAQSMVTLHLNEQTDAKMLIGMYTTGSIPGSFIWRAGVLTTAIREGRWVFIEDLDRAPNEVMSVILPLIERNELLIPSRGETIKATPGFRLIASIRTSLNISGEENTPAIQMLGARLWNRVPVHMAAQDEFRAIINGICPLLHKFLPGIIAVYDRLYQLAQKPSFSSTSRTSLGRPINPRDLLKWCRRMSTLLEATGSKTGSEPITQSIKDEMFMEAADCFAASLQTEEARRLIITAIGEEMHIPPQRVCHYLDAHIPRYEDSESCITIGRVRLFKRATLHKISKSAKKRRPFANTAHAKRLLEQVGVAMKMAEPILLVGETGIGKTTVVQQLAESLGHNLIAVNLSQQSEVGDLLGGFKPVNIRTLAIPIKEEFDDLFAATGISASRNQKYLDQLGRAVAKGQWSKAAKLWQEASRMFDQILSAIREKGGVKSRSTEQPSKRRKTDSKLQALLDLKPRWARFLTQVEQFEVQLSGGSKGFAFTFVEGNIVRAARNGEWVLLDEINLASSDTLESIADLLHSGPDGSPSILLSETGEIERVLAHPNFRIFGAMNPATDVGKKDLPMGLRSRFTEIYVDSPDNDLDDLLTVIKAYLKSSSSNDERAAHDVARLYMNTKQLALEKRLVDGANQVPHFSLRTLTRVLSYVTEIAPLYGLRRALYEGFAMGFLTLLDRESERMLVPLISHHLLDSHGNPQALLSQAPRHPDDGKQYVRFMNKKRDRQYWMLQGCEAPQEQPHYIITPFVERNILNLVRATSTRRFPVLVQGPTSSGKTSMIEYLAKFSGNKFVRINNHEHTDLQEYLGTYVSGLDGQLHFQEGLLVQALREGHWIVLDELNLAPTDVLEALNRLLDDNRELLIPETQEVVRPHENFMLFATQNPPGLYGGRKTLSRAFRNRFLELHFDDIPEDELEFILQHRSQKVAPSDCKRIVTVYKELSRLRQSNRLFEQKDSFATLRDLFRWSLRDADNREQLAANGYMLLGERVRNEEERSAVKEIIERVMKVRIDPSVLYSITKSPEIGLYEDTSNSQGVVWTSAMRRLYILVAHALRNNEPVLLVGETGCGKTTVCQMLAEAFGKQLHVVNAHQNTETGDLIGAQRPIRNRAAVLQQLEDDLVTALRPEYTATNINHTTIDTLVTAYNNLPAEQVESLPRELRQRISIGQGKSKALFEWSDGSLVQAMRQAQYFLLDEISLADDSVLERLNSVLEPQRNLLLAEKGGTDSFVQASEGFQFFATMNPGGDYGKRELSPALRNRFTEIWVPSLSEHNDIVQIVEAKLDLNYKKFASCIVEFAEWFGHIYHPSSAQSVSLRDVLSWISFINGSSLSETHLVLLHGAAMVYIDTLGANPAALLAINSESVFDERLRCLEKLSQLVKHDLKILYNSEVKFDLDKDQLSIGDFSLIRSLKTEADAGFAFEAPTTKANAMRILRALQVKKPILIEGSPGVGKTTLVTALAVVLGKPLTRINLSEQTDLMDLFGSDVPVEGADAGHFAWRDAPFLQSMQRGDWVLLDEMNLASQSVLEGLNACLDHRGEVYISELDQTFKRHPNFTVFAAQNPHHQGGGRKGLPSSFVNRFTVVYADVFRYDDLALICKHNFPEIDNTLMSNMIVFISTLEQEVVYKRKFGVQGGPWEFNLRDILRWLQLVMSTEPLLAACGPQDFLNFIFRQRFRCSRDREEVDRIFSTVFHSNAPFQHLFHNLALDAFQVGIAYLPRDKLRRRVEFPTSNNVDHLREMESVMICVQQRTPCILVGSTGSGKTTLIERVAASAGVDLVVFALNADIDTIDLVGGFEQIDPQRVAASFIHSLLNFLETRILTTSSGNVPHEALEALSLCQQRENDSKEYFTKLLELLAALQLKLGNQHLDEHILMCQYFVDHPRVIENARFEWVDGILITALQNGSWLVLDHANLCSSSVLDRLNSLLEPNGVLSINEHCGPDGEPKLVKPHPNFRLFLTMDPHYGELSRAMRNRAVEIYLDDESQPVSLDKCLSPRVERRLQKYEKVVEVMEIGSGSVRDLELSVRVALDNLSAHDVDLLPRFAQAVHTGLAGSITSPNSLDRVFQEYFEAFKFDGPISLHNVVGRTYERLAENPKLSLSFRDAQTIHPLQNSPLVPLLQLSSHSDQVYWLGVLFEGMLAVLAGRTAISNQHQVANTMKPSQMNRLQRSLVLDRVPTVSKDSTAGVAGFLRDSLSIIHLYLQNDTSGAQYWKDQKVALTSILQFWWETYGLSTARAFDEATFQAHLSLGKELLSSLPPSRSLAEHGELYINNNSQLGSNLLSKLAEAFDSGFRLQSGLSMETIWSILRPLPIARANTLLAMQDLEALAARFDALRWKVPISITELAQTLASFTRAYQTVLTSDVDTNSLVKALDVELSDVELKMTTENKETVPFMMQHFDALRQSRALAVMQRRVQSSEGFLSCMDLDLSVLAGTSTESILRLSSATKTSRLAQSIDFLWGDGQDIALITDTFSTSLLHRLEQIGDVDLGSLRLLEEELPLLGQHISQASGTLCQNQISSLNSILLELILNILTAHDHKFSEEVQQWYFGLGTSIRLSLGIAAFQQEVQDMKINAPSHNNVPVHFQEVFDSYFKGALMALVAAGISETEEKKYSAIAWTLYSVGCITLYVPDRCFDPDKRQRLAHQQYMQNNELINSKLKALRSFERIFTGQDSNLRYQLLEEALPSWDEPKTALPEIFRPQESELEQMQGEFNSLLNVIQQSAPVELVHSLITSDSKTKSQDITLLQKNIKQISRRLSDRFRGYTDMTVPTVLILQQLQVGLLLAVSSSIPESVDARAIQVLRKLTPFMGGILSKSIPVHIDNPLDVLESLSTIATIDTLTSFDHDQRRLFFDIFHSCYQQWSERLDSELKEAETKSGLYKFRGSAEDEEEIDQEQFNELFPTFEEQNSNDTNGVSSLSARDTAISLATVHSKIIFANGNSADTIIDLLRYMNKRVGHLYGATSSSTDAAIASSMLPGAMLALNDYMEALSATLISTELYNFYVDANLAESRKLVILVHNIQRRFIDLQAVDEIGHMQPLEDVLISCRELLAFRHTEPLAKIITKVEKIHAYMHEWQFGGWASRANSVLTLYDDLTSTIVNWRRLELSTWARLFDMENAKCKEDAKSWWFIAYQVVISGPLGISKSESELRIYAQRLLRDLETYFSTAIQGQFAERLQLLKQLQKHLEFLSIDFPLLSIIATAVGNFLEIYSYYEATVKTNIQRGRIVLEKAMKDILLLASWKDTNIVALRDSAKRSHHKLFKLVRKYRTLLGQPMEAVLKHGLPEINESELNGLVYIQPTPLPAVDKSAMDMCEARVPGWSTKNKRFINISKTISLMDDSAQRPQVAIDGSTYISQFLEHVISSSQELQKATPAVLTEDNKVAVKHLKTRKRKLFSEVIKDLREMGIKHNLDTSALARQDSLSVVLANTSQIPQFKLHQVDGLQHYYHRALELLPRARQAIQQHSEDLSNAEVIRGSGLLEGLLQFVVLQHDNLSDSIVVSNKLESTVMEISQLWNREYNINLASATTNHATMLRWLPNILRVGAELVRVHAKLGKTDSTSVLERLSSWTDTFDAIAKEWQNLPHLSRGLQSTSYHMLLRKADDALTTLRSELESLVLEHPELQSILQQILPWATIVTVPLEVEVRSKDLIELDNQLSTTCDSILVAVEQLHKVLQEVPTSYEDPSWLLKEEQCLSRSITGLHGLEILCKMEDATDTLRSIIGTEQDLEKTALARFAVALPIFQQYLSILQQTINRYAQLYQSSCKMTYILGRLFLQILSQGFCTPSEKSDNQDGKTDKLEGGTGLGDGEGAEDISKDIQGDEDLSELAQEPSKGDQEDIEDEQDAVDMADGDMEGQMGEAEEKGDDKEGSGSDSDGEDDIDEEAGDVDDLDPNAVDEKMWDGDGENADKDQEGDESKGKASKDEQVAAQENDKKGADGDEGEDEDEEMEGAEQSEEVTQDDTEDVEKHDPHAEDGKALELPDEMELDGDGNEESESELGIDDDKDQMSDIDEEAKNEDQENGEGEEAEQDSNGVGDQEDQDLGSDLDVIDLDEDPADENGEDTDRAGEKADEDSEADADNDNDDNRLQGQTDDTVTDPDNLVPSDAQGTGEDQNDDQTDRDNQAKNQAQQESGEKGGDSAQQRQAAAEDGEKGQGSSDGPQESSEQLKLPKESQPFKRLGDALEKWHRQNTQIHEPSEQDDKTEDRSNDIRGDNSEFQHLQDEEAESDAQALGTATEEQSRALDESMAIDQDSKDMPETFQPDEVDQNQENEDDVMDLEDRNAQLLQQPETYEGRAGALIEQSNQDRDPDVEERPDEAMDSEDDVEHVDAQLATTHIATPVPFISSRSADDARQLWTQYESSTRNLSLALTEQLRLILAPTQATKMRGDFRTGKRLNIKRIIPYIASQYKRDKIWMRRSVPSKRSYQIMLAVDDSKSMGESGSGPLAFETLVMVSKSLSMLEVGEICVVSFGEDVRVAHEFGIPFSSDAGPKMFQNFGFTQSRTDVTKLITKSIELFRTARIKASNNPKDLWQLQLIISDGVCDSSEHEPIRRLLREAIEERIMMVFVIVDDLKNKRKGESVMDLKEAKFVKNEMTGSSDVKIVRYLDTFPFQYYLIVSDVKELPGVLATLLRQWFAEVADHSG